MGRLIGELETVQREAGTPADSLRTVRAGTCDGDTPLPERDWVRAHADVVLTNPDFLHFSLLPGHERWSRLLRGLRYIVIDECHAYRGILGAHVALVLRRLLRLVSRLRPRGPQPVVLCASAPAAEPALTAARLLGAAPDDVVAVTFDPSEGPDDLLAKYAAAVEASSSQEHLILVDLFGGSPYNAAARFAAGRDDADVVTGVNLPMLIEVLGRRMSGGTLPELVETARTAGAGGVKVLSEIFTPTTTESDDEGDEL